MTTSGAETLSVSNVDDGSTEVSITSVFPYGIRFGDDTYGEGEIFVGSNGYVTFGSGWISYSPLGIAGYTQPRPIIAAQLDDLDPADGGTITYLQDTANNRVVVTFNQVEPYATPEYGIRADGVTFQIILSKPASYSSTNPDFDIELRYNNIGWWQSGNNSSPPAAGWSTGGTSPTYQELPRSGSPQFNLTQNESNVSIPGVYRWSVQGGVIPSPPTVTTSDASSVGSTGATLGGNVIGDGTGTVGSRGVVYSTSTNPLRGATGTTSITGGSGTGPFTVNATGLSPSTTYYARAWAENEFGTGYGREVSFTTASSGPPSVTTSAASSVTSASATLGGNVTSDGGLTVTARGVVLATTTNPTVGSGSTNLNGGSGTGSFTVAASQLNPGVTYYARAYATNGAGTTYGAEVTFAALQLDQSITWNEVLANRAYSPTAFSVSATASSSLAVAFSSVDASVCTASGTSVTMLRSGTCTIRASQPGNVTYSAAPQVDRSFTISKASQTITFDAPDDRAYAPENFSLASLASTSASDNSLSVAFSSQTQPVCTVTGTTVTVNAAGTCTLTAAQSGNDRYLQATPETESFEISPRVLSLSGSRAYDGTRDTTAASLPTVGNLAGVQTLTFSGTATTISPDVGARTPDVTGITIGDGTGGGVASNYTLDGGTHTVTITPRPVRGAFTAAGRIYDGTTAVDDALVSGRTLGAIDGMPASGVVAVDGVLDDVVLDGGVATLAAAAADESTPTTVTLSGATLAGSRAANYTLQSVDTTTATISRRPVTVSGTFTAQDRQYDGSASASIDANGLSLVDTIGADDVTLVPVVAFPTPDVGDGRTVGLTGASTLTGAAAANYRLELTGAPTATADISPRALTVASGSFTVADKVYDGTDVATVSSNDLALTGFATGDSASDVTWEPTGSFTDTTAGASRTVDLAGGAVIQGLKGANYTLDVTGAPTATAAITPRPVTITGASAAARPYDGTTAVVVSGASLANTVAGDVVSLTNATSGVAASRNAGTQGVSTSMTLSGADAANYRLAGQPSLSVTITPLPVDVTMNALPSRAYDGSSALPLSPGALSVAGVLAGESIAVSGTGQLSSRAAGTRTVTVTPTFTPAGGTELVNYTLPTSVSGTVTVTPLPLRVVGASVTSRVWDGSTAATISGATLEGVRAGDAVSLTAASSGTFTSAQPGTHTVRFTPTLVGVDAANYTLSVPELTGTITRAPASLRLTGGLSQFADGSPRTVRAAVSPAGAGRIIVSYGGGAAPTGPGSYPVRVTLDSSTHEASALNATLMVQAVEDLLDVLSPAADPDAGPDADRGTVEERRAAVLARIAVHPDGTRAYPEIGPVLAEDGTTPALTPNDRRVLSDGEPVESRVIVVEDERVRVESDGGFAIELQATIGDGEDRVTLPVDADGTLLLDRGGFVDVGGSGFRPGSTAEVWMFSTVTFLGTAIVDADGGFAGSFPIDDLLEAGDHTIQLNGVGADEQVRSTSLGVRVDDPENSARERIAFASERADGNTITSGPVWLILLAALLGAGTTRWWIVGRRRRDDEEEDEDARVVSSATR